MSRHLVKSKFPYFVQVKTYFLRRGISLWNEADIDVKNNLDLNNFKHWIKDKLYDIYSF